jgi:hypothetical protein
LVTLGHRLIGGFQVDAFSGIVESIFLKHA